MSNLFYLQLVLSFFFGGLMIALISYVAERANKKIAGLILSLPSTVVVSYIFIGWSISPEAVAKAVPSSVITIGAVQLFTVVYFYLSKIKLSKIPSMILCTIGGLSAWFLFATPIAVFKFSSLFWAVVVYALFTLFSFYFLTVKNKGEKTHHFIKYTSWQKIGRAAFAGLVISLAVFLANYLSPFWGGIFSSFPAVFLSTFTILYWYYDSDMLFKVGKAIPLGTLVYAPFTFTSYFTFPAFGIILGTLVAYVPAALVFLVLYKLRK